jgi:hypothetical protein
MGAVKKAITGVGISVAIGAGGYTAGKVFGTPPEVTHEMYMDCLRLDNDTARVNCINDTVNGITWPGLLQLASIVGVACSGYLFYRGVRDELRDPPPPPLPPPAAPPPPPTPLQ